MAVSSLGSGASVALKALSSFTLLAVGKIIVRVTEGPLGHYPPSKNKPSSPRCSVSVFSVNAPVVGFHLVDLQIAIMSASPNLPGTTDYRDDK